MKKKLLLGSLCVMAVVSLMACGKKQSQVVYVDNSTATVVENAPISNDPTVVYATYNDLANAFGYYPMDIEQDEYGNAFYGEVTYSLVNNQIADINIAQSTSQAILYRTCLGSVYLGEESFLTGYEGVQYYTDSYNTQSQVIEYCSGIYEDPTYGNVYIYFWNVADRGYCLELVGYDEATVSWFIEQCLLQSEIL